MPGDGLLLRVLLALASHSLHIYVLRFEVCTAFKISFETYKAVLLHIARTCWFMVEVCVALLRALSLMGCAIVRRFVVC